MRIIDWFKNTFLYTNKYKTHHEAIIIACYFNPQKSPYRTSAFNTFYNSIKHLNHLIIEGVIGDSEAELPESKNIIRVKTQSHLWHKESLLNYAVKQLDEKYKYIFWLDADVLFSNQNWMVEGVKNLQKNNVIQPFEYCVHMDRDELKPNIIDKSVFLDLYPNLRNQKVWRSFCSNADLDWTIKTDVCSLEDYNKHGHVGFAWGARREILDKMPLYDKALVGGADHIIAHAAMGHFNHKCITKSFTDDLETVNQWSEDFYKVVKGKVGYVQGNLYHIWHGDIQKREYLKRIKEFTPKTKNITHKDKNGFYIATKEQEKYVKDYMDNREVKQDDIIPFISAFTVPNQINDIEYQFIIPTDNPSINIHNHEPNVEFGGGHFGGGGASGSWDNTDNFS